MEVVRSAGASSALRRLELLGLLVGLPKYVQTGTRRFLLNLGYKQETRRRKLKTSKTDFHQAENTRFYMIEETDVNGK